MTNNTLAATANSLSERGIDEVVDEVIAPAALASSEKGEPWPRPVVAWYAVFVFGLSLMVNFLDRGILTLLVDPIKRDMGLSDIQISLLMGFAFICFYVLVGLPIARLVDSTSRKTVLASGIALWSVMTGMCGLAQNFWHLFLCRVGVGTGEACSGPATFSMLSDLFPPAKLPRAIAFLNFGFIAGTGGALVIGGAIVGTLSSMPPISIPLIGTLRGWQLAFLIAAVPGLFVALLMTTVPEPKRREKPLIDAAGVAQLGKAAPLREVLRFMRDNATTFIPLFGSVAVFTMLSFGSAMWLPTFYMRQHGWTAAQIGLVQGLIVLVTMPPGAIFGSMLSEWFAKKGYADANLRVVVIAHLVFLPSLIAFPLVPSAEIAVALGAFNSFCASWVLGPQNAALQVITPNRMRGQMTALFLFVFNVIGFGLGPTVIALISDFFYQGSENQLGHALATASVILGPLGILIVFLGMKPYARSVIHARAWVK